MCSMLEPVITSMPVKRESSTLTVHVHDGNADINVE